MSTAGRKARGAFFTPPALASYVTAWAVRGRDDEVLEPSCGEAEFLLAAARRLAGLGARRPGLTGHELHAPSARVARDRLAEAGFEAVIGVGDFFAEPPRPAFDVVIGNPPYVRYQDFQGADRAAGLRAALHAGVRLTGLASSWAAFTVHASLFLKPGGRLGLVLPAELLSVNYAADVRAFLLRRFGRVRLVMFTDRVFPGVLEEVVLLLAEGTGGTDHMEVLQIGDLAALSRLGGAAAPATVWSPDAPRGKWTQALLPRQALDSARAVHAHAGVGTLAAWGETTLGAVTGRNSFFGLRPSEVRRWGIRPADLLAISPPGSRHLRRLRFARRDWDELATADERVWLLRPAATLDLDPATAAYLVEGQRGGVDQAYKCRVRSPWWRVPVPPPADLLLTCMNADSPRFADNTARVHHLNSVHGVYLHPGVSRVTAALLPLAALSSLTGLGAEVVGRAYGGGLLKLEPREADALPVPTPAAVESSADELRAVAPAVDAALVGGDLTRAVALVDAALLVRGLGLPPARVEHLQRGVLAMRARRTARGRSQTRG